MVTLQRLLGAVLPKVANSHPTLGRDPVRPPYEKTESRRTKTGKSFVTKLLPVCYPSVIPSVHNR